MGSFRTPWLGLALLLSLAESAAASGIVNGSLEPTVPFGDYQALAGGSTAIPGWTTTDTGVEWFRPTAFTYPTPPDGDHVVDLANLTFSAGGITQSFSTVGGQVYSATFYIGTHQSNGRDGTAEIVVSADGFSQVFSIVQPSATTDWQLRNFSFTADGDSATLQFRCLQNANEHFAFLDHVVLDKGNVAVGPAVLANGFGISRLAPTPAAGSVMVEFRIPDGMAPLIELVDVAGRVVAREQQSSLTSGDHRARLSLQHVAPGLYFVRLTGPGFTATRKLAILH